MAPDQRCRCVARSGCPPWRHPEEMRLCRVGRPSRRVRASMPAEMLISQCHSLTSAAQVPLLVGAAVAAPELDPRTVGSPIRAGIKTKSGLDPGDRAVGVEV